jgi:3-oxoacyl-[acyl-carrier-protein] synthase III
MRVDGLFVNAAKVLLPPGREPVGRAVGRGLITAEHAASFQVGELPVASPAESTELLALAVAGSALDAAAVRPEDVGLLVHACVGDTSYEWKLAPRLARLLGADQAQAMGLRQNCNGAAAALQLAAAHLLTEPRTENCLVVTSDALGPDWPRRWYLGYGDGATALLLSRRPGRLALRSVATSGRPGNEAHYPAWNPFRPGVPAGPSDESAPQAGFLLRAAVRDAARAAVADAGIDPADPRLRSVLVSRVRPAIARLVMAGVHQAGIVAPPVNLAERSGHLFAGDLTANVADLLCTGAAGELTMIVSFTGDISATCVIVEAS